MNTPHLRASSRPDRAPTSPSGKRKRPNPSPRRAFSVAARAFLTLALATCAFGAAASAQTISISPPPATQEGSGGGQTNFDFTVTIDQVPAQDVTVNFAVVNGTATGSPSGNTPADFSTTALVNGVAVQTNTLTFSSAPNSPTSQIISVPVTSDNLFEQNETFSVQLSPANPPSPGVTIGTGSDRGNGTSVSQGVAQTTILDDDIRPTISIDDATIVEGNAGQSQLRFTVRLGSAGAPQLSGQDVTFNYSTQDAGDPNAVPDQDFVSQTNQVGIIPANQSSTIISVPIIGDIQIEANGQFFVNISNVVGADVGDSQAVGTIIEDDFPRLRVSDASATEADGTIVFLVQLSDVNPQPITIRYSTSQRSATAGPAQGNGADYSNSAEAPGSQTFIIPAFASGDSTNPGVVQIPIQVFQDQISEGDEIFTFTIANATGATVTGPGTDNSAIGTITDDDGAPNLRVVASPTSAAEGDGTGSVNASFVVNLSNTNGANAQSSRDITFSYETVSGTATEGQDFVRTQGTAIIRAGQSASTAITVPIIGDNIDEANETFSFRIFNATISGGGPVTINGGAVDQQAPFTIIDDDGPTISVSAPDTVTEGNNGARTPVAFTVQLSASSLQDVTVRFAFGSGGVNGTEAFFNSDYRTAVQRGTITFPAGTTTQTVALDIIGDNIQEGNEVITLTLSNPTGGTIGTASDIITIRDDDATPTLNIVGPGAAREGSSGGVTNFRFRVTLDRPSSQNVTFNFSVNPGTATEGNATDPGDYTDPSADGDNSRTIRAGSTGPLDINVPVRADRLNEDDETFSVSLSTPSNNARIGIGNAQATIVNDDGLPSVSVFDQQNRENGDPPAQGQQQGPRVFSFRVALNAPSGKTVTVGFQSIGASANNPTLTASSGLDFTPVGGTITFAPGQTEATIDVVVIDDNLNEINEQFQVNLLNVTNANVARRNALGTIIDNDASPNIKIVAPVNADNTAIEPYITSVGGAFQNGRVANFPVTLSAPSGRVITVTYTIGGATATPAFGDDFQASASDPRGFTQGRITFQPGQVTQNITLIPRGNDGNEALVETFSVTINPDFANFAAPADATANSVIEDRDPLFNNFTPAIGFESFGGVAGTVVTITGNQFRTDNIDRVAAVRFNGTRGFTVGANLTITDNTLTVTVPDNAISSFITVLLTDGRVLRPVDGGANRLFYVQPIVTGFNPAQGVPAVTEVIITGRHFQDPRNPVLDVLFNGLVTNANNADRGFTVLSDTQIRAFVPRGATSGPISIRTVFGGNGPPSEQTFTVNAFSPGGIRFAPGSDVTAIFENAQATYRSANGQLLNPVRAYNLLLDPATQNNGNNTPIAPRRSFRVTVSLTATLPVGANQVPPIIQFDPRVRISGITVVNSNGNTITFDVAAGRDPNLPIPIVITYAGNDFLPPSAQSNVGAPTDPNTTLTLPVTDPGIPLSLTAQIISSNDAELYPVTPAGAVPALQFRRVDFHVFAADFTTTLRTTEDQDAPDNRANFRLDLGNLDFPNPDPFTPNREPVSPAINIDARPKRDVLVTLNSTNLNEGQLTYYVIQNGQRIFPLGAQPQNGPLQVIYAVDPTRPEYYRNPHFIQVIGQDDQIADGATPYQVVVNQVRSSDPEYNFAITVPFQLVNTDNEQGTGGNSPGFLFSKFNLNTNESGSPDTFTLALRTRPAGNVSVTFQSTRADEVLFVDPNTGALVSNIAVTFLASGTGNGRTTTFYRTPIAITVRGVDDLRRDGDQQVPIITTSFSTDDAAYRNIDPADLLATNTDNESNGVTVFPTTLNVRENEVSTFSVRLNAQPTSDVIITFSSSDENVATVEGNDTLTFTSANFNAAQTITVRGVADAAFTRTRTATIISSPASSGDTNFNNLTVADVTVIVRNTDSSFVVNSASGGLRTSEAGTNDLFTVSLGQQPTSNVTLVLSANPASEVRLSRTGAAASPSVTLTFTPNNFANPQTVNVIGQDDALADNNKPFTITGRITSADTNFAQQSFPALTGINADNESGTGGGGGGNTGTTSFAANSTFTFSVPFGTSATPNSTIPITSLFTPSSANDFRIYRFDVANQVNSRLIGEDFKLLPNTASLQRGIGYLLQTGTTPLTLNTSAQALAGTQFSVALTRNKNFVNQTGQPQSNNGFNLIGFPFNPSQFGSVSFTSATVTSGSDTYASVRDAAAAGVISDRLYTMDARGVLTQVSASDQVLRPYRAYFVQIYRDDVTLTFRSPSTN